MILGQLRMGARQKKNAPLVLRLTWKEQVGQGNWLVNAWVRSAFGCV